MNLCPSETFGKRDPRHGPLFFFSDQGLLSEVGTESMSPLVWAVEKALGLRELPLLMRKQGKVSFFFTVCGGFCNLDKNWDWS